MLTSAAQLVTDVRRCEPDVLVLDYRIPGEDSLDTLRELRREGLACPCIVWSGYDDIDTVDAAVAAGAHRCVSKITDFKPFLGRDSRADLHESAMTTPRMPELRRTAQGTEDDGSRLHA
ncbi:MAG: response regulator [Phycisphaerales bacterium]|nr:response regulator [Phycisphaerales bacterium]